VKFVVSRLGCDRLIKKSQVVGNPCNNPKASHMYAELVNLIANETPFNDQKIKKLIIKLCEGDCANWDSFYHIFEAMGLRGLNPNSRRSIIDKFVTLFGGYLVLGAHFTINVRNEITIGWFDNIGKLHPNDLLERPDNIEWTKLMNHSKWKWYGYSSSGDQLANDKLTPAEIYNALKKRFPHNHTYKQTSKFQTLNRSSWKWKWVADGAQNEMSSPIAVNVMPMPMPMPIKLNETETQLKNIQKICLLENQQGEEGEIQI